MVAAIDARWASTQGKQHVNQHVMMGDEGGNWTLDTRTSRRWAR
jgi:hypothetical protein